MAASRGLGLVSLPTFIAHRYIERGDLEVVLDDYGKQEIGVYAVLPTNHYIPQRIRLLMEYLSTHLPVALKAIGQY